nr:sensor histidine kinase [Chloroflexota bacterium]
ADLRPPHLDDLGLASTLRWYAKDLQNHAPLEVTVEIAGDERPLNSAIKIALFRVAQEALNNVIKHSGAEHARVRLDYELDAVRLRVEDDGCGFDVAGPIMGRRTSWGLLGMQERAALLGGQFRVESRPGAGTQVDMVIPY